MTRGLRPRLMAGETLPARQESPIASPELYGHNVRAAGLDGDTQGLVDRGQEQTPGAGCTKDGASCRGPDAVWRGDICRALTRGLGVGVLCRRQGAAAHSVFVQTAGVDQLALVEHHVQAAVT